MGDAIYSAGPHASIGPITNSGQIIGNVVIDNQASVTVTRRNRQDFRELEGRDDHNRRWRPHLRLRQYGARRRYFRRWRQGDRDQHGALRLAAPQTIAGNFDAVRRRRARLGLCRRRAGAVRRADDHQAHDARRRPRDRPDRWLQAGDGRHLRHPWFRQPRGRLRRALRSTARPAAWRDPRIRGPAAEACV